jgi:hypothetical protein
MQYGTTELDMPDPVWIGPGITAPAAVSSPMPFLIMCDERFDGLEHYPFQYRRIRFYLWLFGPRFKLPFELGDSNVRQV